MTPAARVAAAIEILDRWLAGSPVEQVLTNWARQNRFAGSKDRAAIRDLVFDAVRRRRSAAAMGGADTGRGLMIGTLRLTGLEPAEFFTGVGHAPAPLTETVPVAPQMAPAEALDCPDWLYPLMEQSLSEETARVFQALQSRAPVFLRVNLSRIGREEAIAALADEGIVARPVALATSAVEVTEGARKVQASRLYAEGLVELQDAASQAVAEMLPLRDGMRVLDYCAGGGGKTLAAAAQARLDLYAHDVDPRRMADLPTRAARAGTSVRILETAKVRAAGPFDLVLLDVPCSGSGSWRRSPEAKWLLTSERLAQLVRIQTKILDIAAELVADEGAIAYVTCSLLDAENRDQTAAFLSRHTGWRIEEERRLTPLDGGDGFYLCIMRRA